MKMCSNFDRVLEINEYFLKYLADRSQSELNALHDIEKDVRILPEICVGLPGIYKYCLKQLKNLKRIQISIDRNFSNTSLTRTLCIARRLFV